jgi:hypothetical protein
MLCANCKVQERTAILDQSEAIDTLGLGDTNYDLACMPMQMSVPLSRHVRCGFLVIPSACGLRDLGGSGPWGVVNPNMSVPWCFFEQPETM